LEIRDSSLPCGGKPWNNTKAWCAKFTLASLLAGRKPHWVSTLKHKTASKTLGLHLFQQWAAGLDGDRTCLGLR